MKFEETIGQFQKELFERKSFHRQPYRVKNIYISLDWCFPDRNKLLASLCCVSKHMCKCFNCMYNLNFMYKSNDLATRLYLGITEGFKITAVENRYTVEKCTESHMHFPQAGNPTHKGPEWDAANIKKCLGWRNLDLNHIVTIWAVLNYNIGR